MSYLLDTDELANYLRGREGTVSILEPLLHAKVSIGMSIITYGEIYEGIAYGRDPQAALRGLRQFLRAVGVLPLNQSVMRRFAILRGELRRTGQLIGDFDTLIAATALQYDLTLITRNLSHFQRIPGISILT